MKKKELLQKSSAVAAVVLAAALMDPGAVRAASLGAVSDSTKVMEQSVGAEENEQEVAEESGEEKLEEEQPAAESPEQQETGSEETPEDVTEEETENSGDTEQTENSASDEETDSSESADTADENTESGWITDENGNIHYRDENGNILSLCVVRIGDQYYGFDYEGNLICGQSFQFQIGGERYKAKEDGTLYVNTFIEENGGTYYYGDDGAAIMESVKKIGDYYYGFDNNGKMYKNTEFRRYVDGNTNYYRAKEDGTLYVNTFAETDGITYYYGEEGVRFFCDKTSGCVKKIGDHYYGFEYGGGLYKNIKFKIYAGGGEFDHYRAREDGTLYVDCYLEEDGKTYYYDEEAKENLNYIRKIGDEYYGYCDGNLAIDQIFYIGDQYDTNRKKYRTKADGSLYRNEAVWEREQAWWYEKQLYYYGPDGLGVTGLYEVEGILYYFSSGYARTNTIVEADGIYYFASEKGNLTKVKNNAWNRIEGEYYYVKDGEKLSSCIEKVGNAYYGFDSNGRMYSDEIFDMGMNQDGEWHQNTYCAARDGSLKKNTWVKKSRSWYYFGADGAGYEGFQMVNGKTYYFESAKMLESTFKNIDGKMYLIWKDGKADEVKNNSWVKAWGDWYYVADGEILKDCVKKIGNAYYIFDEQGRMYADQFVEVIEWGEGEHRGEEIPHKYFAKEDGALAAKCWLKKAGEWYYFDEAGEGVKGIQTINGVKYYFDTGKMQTSGTVEENGISYEIRSDGTLKQTTEKDGWVKRGKNWYYVKDHTFYRDTIEKINGKLYGFDQDGKMYSNQEFYKGEFYFADENGALYTNRWRWLWGEYQKKYVYYYYDEDGQRILSGIKTINGNKYLFAEGMLVQNQTRMNWDDNTEYVTDENGRVDTLKEGWNHVGRYWYYVKDGSKLVSSEEMIEGSRYCFDSKGHMMTNANFLIENQWYVADDNGKLYERKAGEVHDGICFLDTNGNYVSGIQTIGQKEYYFENGYICPNRGITSNGENYASAADGTVEKLPYHGWKAVDGNLYYIDQGKLIKGGTYIIGNKTYVFSPSGRMMTSKNGVQVKEEVSDDKQDIDYAAAEDGTVLKNTWMKFYDEKNASTYWQYFDGDGLPVSGMITLKGRQYYLDSKFRLYENRAVWEGINGNYAADESGVLKPLNRNGWTRVGKNRYYCWDGIIQSEKILKIGNEYYAFDEEARMYANQDFTMNGVTYRADASGKLLQNTSWKDANGDLYYYDADGAGYEGTHKINGVTYYFEGGKLLKNTAFYDSYGNCYVADSKGNRQSMAANGWKNVDGIYYYAVDGVIQKNTIIKINGNYYGFDADGRMYENVSFQCRNADGIQGTYYADKSGALRTSQKYQSGKDTYYFDESGRGYEGVHVIDGKQYQFHGGKMVE